MMARLRSGRAYLAGGARLLQIRASDVTSGEYLAWCDEIMKHATDAGAQVIVNDRTDIATVAGAAGVHLGQSDLSPDMARRVVPTTMMLGLSTHTRAQLDGSTTVAVDYVAVGPSIGPTRRTRGTRRWGSTWSPTPRASGLRGRSWRSGVSLSIVSSRSCRRVRPPSP